MQNPIIASGQATRPSTNDRSFLDVAHDLAGVPQQIRASREQLAEVWQRQERQQGAFDALARDVAKIAHREQSIDHGLGTIAAELGRIREGQDTLRREHDLLAAASEQQKSLAEKFFEDRVIDPLARMLIPTIDLMEEALRRTEDASSVATEFQAARGQLLELLSVYEVQSIACQPGEPFNPKIMSPVGQTPTAERNKDRTVARVLRVGYERRGRLLRAVFVDIHRFVAAGGHVTPTGDPS